MSRGRVPYRRRHGTPGQTPPRFLSPLARRASGSAVLCPPLEEPPDDWMPRSSAVLILVTGTDAGDCRLLLEERSHTMRSQPGHYALPGGRAEPTDADATATALREAQEETGLDPAGIDVLGAFAPIAMPWRNYAVSPVLAWAPEQPQLGEIDPAEVESLAWIPLCGPGSLTDPAVHCIGTVDGRRTGAAFDLPGGMFVWGFTAMILDAVVRGLDLPGVPLTAAPVEVPALRRSSGRAGRAL